MKIKTMNNKNKILKILTRNSNSIKKFGVKRIGLFGSHLTGHANEKSDIDILVEFSKGNEKFSNLMNLYTFLNNLLDNKVDLVTFNSISPYIKPYILKESEYIEKL